MVIKTLKIMGQTDKLPSSTGAGFQPSTTCPKKGIIFTILFWGWAIWTINPTRSGGVWILRDWHQVVFIPSLRFRWNPPAPQLLKSKVYQHGHPDISKGDRFGMVSEFTWPEVSWLESGDQPKDRGFFQAHPLCSMGLQIFTDSKWSDFGPPINGRK